SGLNPAIQKTLAPLTTLAKQLPEQINQALDDAGGQIKSGVQAAESGRGLFSTIKDFGKKVGSTLGKITDVGGWRGRGLGAGVLGGVGFMMGGPIGAAVGVGLGGGLGLKKVKDGLGAADKAYGNFLTNRYGAVGKYLKLSGVPVDL